METRTAVGDKVTTCPYSPPSPHQLLFRCPQIRERTAGAFSGWASIVFRNYLLGHMAKMAPLGINLLIHRLRGVKMGKGVYIDPSATVETAYPENITIGNDVRITANAIIMTHIRPHTPCATMAVPLVESPVVLEDQLLHRRGGRHHARRDRRRRLPWSPTVPSSSPMSRPV
ncbi:MAG: hypothetical protein U0176_00060 [Bacteroidia bacterium]